MSGPLHCCSKGVTTPPPPPLLLSDDEETDGETAVCMEPTPIRRDYVSQDMRYTHPGLPVTGTFLDRQRYLQQCDTRAYNTIRREFPEVKPPHMR